MNIETLEKSNRIIFKCIAGSHAYGTTDDHSDHDIRGIFRAPKESWISLQNPPQQISDEKQDIQYYELKKFFDLASGVNPNLIELLWIPEDCILIKTPLMENILKNRNLFISKKAFHTFSGYAFSQIKRCRGRHKWVHNAKPKEKPKKEDFCWVIYRWKGNREKTQFPCRPIPLNESGYPMMKDFFIANASNIGLDKKQDLNYLSKCHCSSLEHVPNVYRLYFYGNKSKGVFRGDNIVHESIPIEDEHNKFRGLLIYNEQAYEKAVKDWKNYWDWKKNRNESRWVKQETGELDYDAKNMAHCFRLLRSGKNILINGEPIVRFSGNDLKFLKDVREGKFEYDYLIKKSEDEVKELERLYESSKIPNKVNMNKINNLYINSVYG